MNDNETIRKIANNGRNLKHKITSTIAKKNIHMNHSNRPSI